MVRPRILIAEDHADVAAQLRDVLGDAFDVVATVSDGFAMVGAARTLRPDVIIADVAMPLMDGISAAAEVRRDGLESRIVFVSVHGEPAVVRQAMAAGGSAFVSKLRAGEDLVPAVWSALAPEGQDR